MVKLSSLAIAGIFYLASSTVPVWAASTVPDASAPYLTTSRSLPRNTRAPFAKFQFGINVAGYSVSQISIDLPDRISVGSVSVRGADNQVIEASTTVKNGSAIISFTQQVSPGTALRIQLSSVRTLSMLNRVWLMPVSVKRAETATDTPIGIARIHTYSN
ncbi:hypothetical protein [Acaryochloris sp. CCMEE 5410]|uniref:hypothetical protein n=1 Tax=Acaryochloris sp. CCMEE 5410 TaxID=310037 RepID=UPI0011125C98|nr:hypothetical protein [Acaryochloris sp. CCMEE 5410]KAI9130097.1 hypothetical protein ON05_031190 [Acaryochloris sp. CCMEE 5410]